jgi:DNA-binding beta-propeller fold protein YncE
LDPVRNKLYVGTIDPLRVVDCGRDSVIATISGVDSVGALCYNPTAGKVYATAGETLYAVETASDSVVLRRQFDRLAPLMTCDPGRNRLFVACTSDVYAIDCVQDSVAWGEHLWSGPVGIAHTPAQDKVYLTRNDMGVIYNYIMDGATGQTVARRSDLRNVPYYGAVTDQMYFIREDDAVTVLDCSSDTIEGVVPLTATSVRSVCIDSVDNKPYFAGSGGHVTDNPEFRPVLQRAMVQGCRDTCGRRCWGRLGGR